MKYASVAAVLAVFLSPMSAIAAVGHHVPHHVGLNCGFPHPDAGCSAVAPVSPAPVPSPTGPATPKDVFSGLLQFQGQVVADLQQADTTQAMPINPATGAAWNPYAHECLAGTPAVGTIGQPGYVPATQGLIAWVQGLAPLAASTVPPLPANPSAATIAVHADDVIMAAEGTANSLLTQINTGGVPSDLQIACGSMINHVSTEVMTATAQVSAFTALLAKYVMPLVAAEKAGH